MGWGFTPIVMLLAIPASLAALAVLRARRAQDPATASIEQPTLAHN
jgi:hypothetical protein